MLARGMKATDGWTRRPTKEGGVALADVGRVFATGRGRRVKRIEALAGLTLRVQAGEVVALVGPSGCGKTTLLELVCGLQAPDTGTVEAAPAVLMPQRDLLLPWMDALDNAALARRVAGASREEARSAARPLFSALGLEGFEDQRPAALSGGM
ncbi:MAG TPA: ATP-binding cassette domain-containing protein, partial [Solirubrobacteraceae bacterium]|nr:ATP-binding cassette domain-containing protein [Solirubrobacteraceae bacterium]